MAVTRTIEFLPAFFKTEQNNKFLSATLDQLVSEPELLRLSGYIGRKNSPNYKLSDNYLAEPSTSRGTYQLEPSVITRNQSGVIDYVAGYQDLTNKLSYLGVNTADHSRLYSNEYYSYNGMVSFDKFTNFSQYYWLPNGPDSVDVSGAVLSAQTDYELTLNSAHDAFTVSGSGSALNPSIVVSRGGNYTFTSTTGSNIWIQTSPGLSGTAPSQPNKSSREVVGVTNNGTSQVTFTVPSTTAQDNFIKMPLAAIVDLQTTLQFGDIHGVALTDFIAQHGGIDGVSNIADKLMIFAGSQQPTLDEFPEFNLSYDAVPYDAESVNSAALFGVWKVTIDVDGVIVLLPIQNVSVGNKVAVLAGTVGSNREFYRNTNGQFTMVPVISVIQPILYYQDSVNAAAVGELRLVELLETSFIDVERDILGKKVYTSPNQVTLTNGLKIRFSASVTPAKYANNVYYVEGVGTSIALVLVSDLVTPEHFNGLSSIGFDFGSLDSSKYDETFYVPNSPQYITINRTSVDLNPWSRNNRWFHQDVINLTAQYNKIEASGIEYIRAARPIIEFDANIALFNFGRNGKKPVHIYDTTVTDAFGYSSGGTGVLTVAGNSNVMLDGVALANGMRVIFAADTTDTVRNKIYVVNIVDQDATSTTPQVVHLTIAPDGEVATNDSIVVMLGETNQSKSFWYNGKQWVQSQQYTAVNQEPLFDMFDKAGHSFGGTTYLNTTFAGTKILSYRRGTGSKDPVLGFPMSFRNFSNIGDIVFDNNYVTDAFTYNAGKTTALISTGTLGEITGASTLKRRNIWTPIVEDSKQYQQFTFFYTTDTKFAVNITADADINVPNTRVFVNNQIIDKTQYEFVSGNTVKYINILKPLVLQDKVDVYMYSSTGTAANGSYQIPVNLDNNSVNLDFETITLGQMRNHVSQCFDNSADTVGVFPGSSNIRDIGVKDNPGKILQHSAPLPYSMLFMTSPTASFEKGLDLARREYSRFKYKFLEAAYNSTDIALDDPVSAVDEILASFNSYKTMDMAWARSDMVPYGDDTVVTTHNVDLASVSEYEISRVFNPAVPSSNAVLVYLNGTQLLLGTQYQFSTTRPAITLSSSVTRHRNDTLTIVEYDNTDGCWIPETPTKLGLYPVFTPAIFEDSTYRTAQTVIRGHDGSITVAFGDYRDNILLELEKRIYNNIKVKYDPTRLDINAMVPGKFRNTSFSRGEFNAILAKYFLSWAGANRVEYQANTFYQNSDGFTWNYNNFVDKIDGERLPGNWRGIYQYFFDCTDPSTRPWEMLGFSEEPQWWQGQYGTAPYTSGNLILWDDLAQGKIRQGDRSGTHSAYARPELLQVLPVSEYGELLSPHEFVVKQYEQRNTVGNYVVGDCGPVENAWRNSSEYPFAIQYAMALTHPAKYFGLQLDTYSYIRDVELGQYLNATTNNRLARSDIKVHGEDYDGTISRSTGYLNWIADYIRNLGMDAKAELTQMVNEFTVQLSYKVAGFTDKKMLKMFAEQATPTSTSDSIMIPSEDYSIFLNKSVPLKRLVYSAVILTKTSGGWAVDGYNLDNPFFSIIPSDQSGGKQTIYENGVSVTAYADFLSEVYEVPYGTELSSRQQVVDFLLSYERYLRSQGFVFSSMSSELATSLDWTLSSREFMSWSQQGWADGKVLVLSPAASQLTLKNNLFIVDSFNNSTSQSKILDLNFKMLTMQDFRVFRDTASTTVTAMSQSIGLAAISAVQYEHVIVFENKTVFSDIIYQPELGNRQSRIKVIGQKTGNWDGSLFAPGYILNQGTVPVWQPGTDYKKADIVEYKGQLYVASADLPSQDSFKYLDWMVSDYTAVDQGLLPNFALRAGQVDKYYDIDTAQVATDINKLSTGLIGFGSRGYLTDIGLDDTSQVKFYQGYIKEKGTQKSIESLTRAQIDRFSSDISFFEEWAVRVGEYGALDSTQSVELIIGESQFTANPSFVSFLNDSDTRPLTHVGVKMSELYKKPKNYAANLFLTNDGAASTLDHDFKTAGPVRLDDVDYTLFDIEAYAELTPAVSNMGDGQRLWVAKDFSSQWNVYRLTRNAAQVTTVTNLGDNMLLFATDAPHGMSINELTVLRNISNELDAVYKTLHIPSTTSFVVLFTGVLPKFEVVTGLSGYVLTMMSVKSAYASGISDITAVGNWEDGDAVWVSNGSAMGGWAVYEKSSPWVQTTALSTPVTASAAFGRTVVKAVDGTVLAANLDAVNVFTNNTLAHTIAAVDSSVNFGKTIAVGSGSLVAISDTAAGGRVHVYRKISASYIHATTLTSLGATEFGYSMSMSTDDKWLYISSPAENIVAVYANTGTDMTLVTTITTSGILTGDRFGHAISCNASGSQVAISAPNHSTTIAKSGAVYVFDREVDAFIADGVSKTFTTVSTAASISAVTIDRVVTAGYTRTDAHSITFATAPAQNSTVRIETNVFNLLQQLTSKNPSVASNFGYSIAMSADAVSLFVGSPDADDRNSEQRDTGCVVRFMQQAKQYNEITGKQSPVTNIGDSFRISDFVVHLAGTSAASAAIDINSANIPGISASVVDSALRIVTNPVAAFTKLELMPCVGSALADLGLMSFVETQQITSPYMVAGSRFGETLAVDNSGVLTLAVGCSMADSQVNLVLDTGETVFDEMSTTIYNKVAESGVVYVFQELGNPVNSITEPGNMTYSQTLASDLLTPADGFGSSIAIGGATIYVGAPGNDSTAVNGGRVVAFANSGNRSAWAIKSSKEPVVDVGSINSVYMYNTVTSEKIAELDFIDPARGRILGAASQEIDFKTHADPAYYNTGTAVNVIPSLAWDETQVGKVWWDLSAVRWLDYEQGEFTYRSASWAKLFPGSQVKVYEWTASTVAPSVYVSKGNDGVPSASALSNYTTKTVYDNISGLFITKYFFWVEKTTSVKNSSRKYSLTNLVAMIESPDTTGIPYVAFVSPSAIGMWNITSLLDARNVSLHVDYDVEVNSNLIHSEFQLVQEGNAATEIPTQLTSKIIDSLCGADAYGNAVPDPMLAESEKYGIGIRPMQSVFKDSKAALHVLVDSVNSLFSASPILQLGYDVSGLSSQAAVPTTGFDTTVPDITSLGYIDTAVFASVLVEFDSTHNGWSIYKLVSGVWVMDSMQQVHTANYWDAADWYDSAYAGITKFSHVVNTSNDVAKLALGVGDTVKIRNSGDGNFKICVYTAEGTLRTVGLQNATIKLSTGLYSTATPAEIRNVLNVVVAMFEGNQEYNDLFFSMIRFAMTEQKNIDWIFKTSFVTVLHKIRKLDQFATYQKDNQTFVQQFIEEVKPYRTQIREYLVGYEYTDASTSDVSDFDLPGYYDVDYLRFRSPSGESPKDAELYDLPANNKWAQNHTYSVGSIRVDNAGFDYIDAPLLEIVGNGTGATAVAVVANGAISRIRVTNPGSGYTVTPTVNILGSGTGAKLSVRLLNETTRKISTTIKFDRITYGYSTIAQWTPSTALTEGELVTYADVDYIALTSFVTPPVFNTVNLDEYSTAADRVRRHYAPKVGMPPADLGILFSGTEYDGVNVTGQDFVNGMPVDTIVQSSYTDSALGIRPEDIIISGGEYVDAANSHAPEELIPGIIFDTLDIRVFTRASDELAGIGAGPKISVFTFAGDGVATAYDVTVIGEHGDTIFVFSSTGPLTEGTDFVYDRELAKLTLTTAPAVGETIIVQLMGSAGYGKISDEVLPTDSTTTVFTLGTEFASITDTYIAVNGVRIFDYSISGNSTGGTDVALATAYAGTDHVHFYAYSGTIGKQLFSETYTQLLPITGGTYPADYTLTLDRAIQYSTPLAASVIVELADRRLRPANNAYYIADGISTTFAVPLTADIAAASITGSDIAVYVNNVELVNSVGFNLIAGTTAPRSIQLTAPVAVGSPVVVSLLKGAEFKVTDATHIVIDPTVTMAAGDTVKVITFSNHDALKLRTQVFVGETDTVLVATPGFGRTEFSAIGYDSSILTTIPQKIYHYTSPDIANPASPVNSNYVWVTLNGERMRPNYDFMLLERGVLQLGEHVDVTLTDVVVITAFTENTQLPMIGFRIFKDMNDTVEYYRISEENSTVLARDLLITDPTIYLHDVTGLPVPNPALAEPGVIFINGERITYYAIDSITNTVSGLRRGTAGTGASTHLAGQRVAVAGIGQVVPNGGAIWQNSGMGLSYSNTPQAKFLLDKPSFDPT